MNSSAPTVILLEDDEDIADLFSQLISTYGALPIVCTTHEDVMRAVEQNDIALALLDVMLPDADGRIVAQALHDANVSFPFYFMTGIRESDIGEDYCKLAQGILQKPISIEKLREILHKTLGTDTQMLTTQSALQRRLLTLSASLATEQESLRRQQTEFRSMMQAMEAECGKSACSLTDRMHALLLGIESSIARLGSRVEDVTTLLQSQTKPY